MAFRASDRPRIGDDNVMPMEITLLVGETHVLPLEGRGSGGYVWSYKLSGDINAVEIRIEGVRKPFRFSDDRPAAGSVQEQLVVTGLSPGRVELELAQRRAWEKEKPAIAEQFVVVRVYSDFRLSDLGS